MCFFASGASHHLCFDDLAVPILEETFYINASRDAEDVRQAGWAMCGVDNAASDSIDTRFWFANRKKTRSVVNFEDLCSVANDRAYAANDGRVSARHSCTETLSLCERVREIFDTDILVSPKGSDAELLLPFARRGTVVIMIQPYSSLYAIPKLLAFQAGLQPLDFLMTAHHLFHCSLSTRATAAICGRRPNLAAYGQCGLDCPGGQCFNMWRDYNMHVPEHDFLPFLRIARNLVDQAKSRLAFESRTWTDSRSCAQALPHEPLQITREMQRPLWEWPWESPVHNRAFPYHSSVAGHSVEPDAGIRYARRYNYQVCEPQDGCICCKSKSCMQYAHNFTLSMCTA